MADDATDDEVFPGYRFAPDAAARASRSQASFRRTFLALAPGTMFDTEPQQMDKVLSRLAAEDGS